MTTGTCYFPSYGAALRYYRPYVGESENEGERFARTRDDQCRKLVDQKLNEGEIRIGKPDLKPGQTLSIQDNRYHITERSMKFTLNSWRDDMGTFTQPGCSSIADALWHLNKAREHDGLTALSLAEFNGMLSQPRNSDARATLTPEN